jgi:beta-1,4-mannosyltransferase
MLQQAFPFPPSKQLIIPHGHFADQYPGTTTKQVARAWLGLPEHEPVLLLLGQCQPYKNVLFLIDEHRRRTDAAILLIAGRFSDAGYEAECQSAASGDSRIIIHSRYIPDDEVQHYLAAADLFVAPYRDILTSGSAVLAASFGVPVVSIDRGFLRDYITEEMGVLYPPEEEGAFRRAVDKALTVEWSSEAIIGAATSGSFETAAAIFLAGLEKLGGGILGEALLDNQHG